MTKQKDTYGFESLGSIDGLFKQDALPDNFTLYCEQYPYDFKMKPYHIDDMQLLDGYYIIINHIRIKEVTKECGWPEDCWYDKAYIFRHGEKHFLLVHKMFTIGSYLEELDREKIEEFLGEAYIQEYGL